MNSMIPPRFKINSQPLAQPEAIVNGPHVRFTVLTSRLIRLEYSPQDCFEDRASQVFWHRRQPAPDFRVVQSPDQLEIITEHLHLRYVLAPGGFRDSLSIELRQLGARWRYGERDWHNLLGTARTLDGTNGPIHIEPGLMSRRGWAVVDDSSRLVFSEAGWLEPQVAPGKLDLYFFGYGHDYVACLRDFCQVAGPMPLVPRWVLGNWWSRYWAYSQDELIELMQDFERHDAPLAVCVIDMDWHITQTGNASSGWTGYTWNRKLFPDPKGLLHWLHERGLKVTLNLHPADGVHPHEARYQAMARRMGVNPASGQPVLFDIANPEFAAAYFDILHHPLEEQGVDFWWIDWQQGERTNVSGLDPLWWLNHLHYNDLARAEEKRPFIFSRWGGLGNHRYPIGFSGDTFVTWETLAFQPYFTATAANVGYGWWSHDIGGHQRGIEDHELYTRWVQFGVFSPVLRLHSTSNSYHERRPWGYDAETLRITRSALQLRHALLPYLYSMAWRCHVDARPLVLPMYYLDPEAEDAYCCPNQYYFGSELIAAPFVSPADPDTRLSRQAIWLPQGDWFNFFSGEHYQGGRWLAMYGTLEEIPVLAKAGGIIPLGPQVGWGGLTNPDELTLCIFPGADNTFELYEDDGETQAYVNGKYAVTRFSQAWGGTSLQFTIAPVEGDLALVPARRTFKLVVRGVSLPDRVSLTINNAEHNLDRKLERKLDRVLPSSGQDFSYDEQTETLAVQGVVLGPADKLALELAVGSGMLLAKRDRRLETCRKLLRAFRLDTGIKQQIDDDLVNILQGHSSLIKHSRTLGDAHLNALQSVL